MMVTEFFDVDQEISLISGDIIISFTFHLFTFHLQHLHFSPCLSIQFDSNLVEMCVWYL
jgi:hypothetical protein